MHDTNLSFCKLNGVGDNYIIDLTAPFFYTKRLLSVIGLNNINILEFERNMDDRNVERLV